jgi:hypothetical protein
MYKRKSKGPSMLPCGMVNRTILLSKLKVYKLDDLSLNWFRSYLSERSQKVIINNYESSAQNIRYGIRREVYSGIICIQI